MKCMGSPGMLERVTSSINWTRLSQEKSGRLIPCCLESVRSSSKWSAYEVSCTFFRHVQNTCCRVSGRPHITKANNEQQRSKMKAPELHNELCVHVRKHRDRTRANQFQFKKRLELRELEENPQKLKLNSRTGIVQ